jgi:hypothetical protein
MLRLEHRITGERMMKVARSGGFLSVGVAKKRELELHDLLWLLEERRQLHHEEDSFFFFLLHGAL